MTARIDHADVIVEWRGDARTLEERLQAAAAPVAFRLHAVAAEGGDVWRCRFQPAGRGGAVTRNRTLELLRRVGAAAPWREVRMGAAA